MTARHQCLVIGYGNPLRHDDGAGVKVAQTIEALNLPGVKVITRHQLVPELAVPISESKAVIFVDADPTAIAGPELRPIEASASAFGQIMAHAANPNSLLALARELFGRHPEAWSLAIPVEDFSFGVGLSERSNEGLSAAVRLFREFVAGSRHS
ncbi:MAG TPA: hydrogenase maturation protease [Alphaproteobacteria bacterium]|nr:hydrogenase maturation protease [Alphaproteobacteria bacterium]